MPDVLRLHRQSLEEFGGAEGIREPGLIESALVSAQNEHYYRQGDLDRQSHWHIDVRTTSGNRVARFEFENVFGIHRILTLLKSAPTDYSHEDFLKVLAEFEANYSIPDLLAA